MWYEQDISRLGAGSGLVVAAVAAGSGSGGACGAFCARYGAQRIGSGRDPGELWRGAWVSAVSPGDDGGAAALRLQPRCVLLAADCTRLRGAAGLCGGDGDAAAG